MIIECPACKTSHSKAEKDVAGGTPVVCRRCARSFRVAADKSTELVASGPAATTSGFDNVPTSLLSTTALAALIKPKAEPVVAEPAAPEPEAPEPEAPQPEAPEPEAPELLEPMDASTDALPFGESEPSPAADDVPVKRKLPLVLDFPWRPAWHELRALFVRQPLTLRVAVIALLALPWLLMLLTLIASVGEDIEVAFARDAAPIGAGAQAGDAYTALGTLEQGERVRVFAHEGDFVLVRDAMGRAGFVPAMSLSEQALPSPPERPFAECKRAPVEADVSRCQGRAQEQFDSCRNVCGASADETTCLTHCQTRFGDCMRTCEGEAAQLLAPSAKEPKMVEPDLPVAADLPAPVVEAAPETAATKRKKAPSPRHKKKRGR